MNGVVVRRAMARAVFTAVAGLLSACQSYQTFQPTIASAPAVGPAGKVVLSGPAISGPAVSGSSQSAMPVAEGTVALPSTDAHGSVKIENGVASGVGGFCSNCNGSCTGRCGTSACRTGCGPSFKQKLRDADWEQLRTDHCWPEQYNFEARRRVGQPLHDQIAAGHVTHNTLHDLHFESSDENRGILHDSGKERLKYLVRRRPYVVPTVFVQTSFDPTIDAEREKNIRAYIDQVSTEPNSWQVVMVNTAPTGLFGREGSYTIKRMAGADQGQTVPTPKYESTLKNGFFQGTGGGQQNAAGGS